MQRASRQQKQLPPRPDSADKSILSSISAPEATPPTAAQHYEHELEALRLDLAEIHLKSVAAHDTYARELQRLTNELTASQEHNVKLVNEVATLDMLLASAASAGPRTASAGSESGDATTPSTLGTTPLATPLGHDGELSISDLRGMSTLAEELLGQGIVEPGDDVPRDFARENRRLQETNLAMSMYIERIVQKLLGRKDLEYILESDRLSSPVQRETSPPLPPPQKTSTILERRSQRKKYLRTPVLPVDHVTHPEPSPQMPTSSSLLIPEHSPRPSPLLTISGGVPSSGGTSPFSPGPTSANFRRVTSGGQTTLLPLRLPGSISPIPPFHDLTKASPMIPEHDTVPAEEAPSETISTTLVTARPKTGGWLKFKGSTHAA
ncbi:uncharacterized protein V1518DRAFT_424051 [Limtongia smithiae]|uniref:uncharacterized protein n=1 Tax=Limtongia smithiae TaxID=1125753 RepID=UPI0034CDC5A5